MSEKRIYPIGSALLLCNLCIPINLLELTYISLSIKGSKMSNIVVVGFSCCVENQALCDVDFIDYSARIQEMIVSGMVARYEVGRNGEYDDEEVIQEELVGGISPYSDVGDIAVSMPTEFVKKEEPKKEEIKKEEPKKEETKNEVE